ncbi:hypothetical protein H9L10_01380 [Phycicoccus endophyticus]|uniref:Polysaccharide biosynthesis tyrosine autokinase n=2 Tax=Phycicoccus endophyticus TaxID=1690220 RepID=A0A7G9R2F2_9MICO|nr:polysaccharide biosynthesis tyrosine autokinase [Phycicoccus endophyticus]NHI20839.1 hypothetical protein [Phycicoccus endophyticus]QNN49777.1 hypothetical protein H9L10_01380 [Phycicoccus endophyticus]GGL35069.1 hypothetical protein GCM10012283_16850 [Phycicoccus endophyticus]
MDGLPHTDERTDLVRDALRRHAIVILVLGVVFGALGFALTQRSHDVYTSEAKVLIRPTVGNPLSPDATSSSQRVTVAMVTEAALVDSPVIADRVAEATGESAADALRSVSADVPANTQLVAITVRSEDPATAQAEAQRFAEEYLAYREEQSTSVTTTEIDNLKKQEESVQKSLAAAGKAAAVTDAQPDANAQVQLYAGRLATIQNSIATAQATDIRPGSVVLPATSGSVQRNLMRLALPVLALVIGLALGVAWALLRSRRDDRVRAVTGHTLDTVPVLATVPATAPGAREVAGEDDAAVAESYRLARAALLAEPQRRGRVVAVAGCTPQTSAGDVAANLALSLARAGYSVVLVDASGSQDGVGAELGMRSAVGFADLLGHAAPDADDIEVTRLGGVSGVDVVAAGRNVDRARDLYYSESMGAVIASLVRRYDLVVLAAASVPSAEGSGVVLAADSLVAVVEEGRTSHRDLQVTAERAAELRSTLLGVVVVPSAAPARRRIRGLRTSDGAVAPQPDATTVGSADHT